MWRDSLAHWNNAIALATPTIGDLKELFRVQELGQVTPEAADLAAITGNLVVTVRPTDRLADTTLANSLGLVVDPSYFIDSQVVFSTSEPFRLFGIPMPASAQTTLDRLRALPLHDLSLASQLGIWTIYCHKALALHFLGRSDFSTDPADSRLAYVEFFFPLQYSAEVLPVLET